MARIINQNFIKWITSLKLLLENPINDFIFKTDLLLQNMTLMVLRQRFTQKTH